MNEDGGSRDGFIKNRPVLGEITNRQVERCFRLIPGKFVLKNEVGYPRRIENEAVDDDFSHQVCRGVEDLVKDKENSSRILTTSEITGDCNAKGLSLLNVKRVCRSMNSGHGDESLVGNVVSDVPKIHEGIKECSRPLIKDLHAGKAGTSMHGIIEGDGSRGSCIPAVSIIGQCDKTRNSSPTVEGEPSPVIGECEDDDGNEALLTHLDPKDDLGKNVTSHIDLQENKMGSSGNLIQGRLNNFTLVGCSLRPSRLAGLEVFNLEGNVKADTSSSDGAGALNFSDSHNSDKICSCSFCLKAAYVWSELQFQDTKGRLAALKRSRKQARCLIGTFNCDDTEKNVQQSTKKSAKSDFELMHQWRSLFLHTEDVLVRESNQLQSNLHRVKALRGSCKTDLEMINRVTLDKA